MSRVICDQCNKRFKIDLKTEPLTRNRVGHYFKCPRCKVKYPVAAYTEKGVFLLKEMKEMSFHPGTANQLKQLKQKLKNEVSKGYKLSDVI